MQGQLKKMHTRLNSPVQYDLQLGNGVRFLIIGTPSKPVVV
jgi:hypothetical protein